MPEKTKEDSGKGFSPSEKVDFAVFTNARLERDNIKSWLKKDVHGVYLLLSEILSSNEVLEALTEVFWNRYLAFHEGKKSAPEIDFNGNKVHEHDVK